MSNPYQFPLKSRQAMTAYLAEHESYWPMNSWNRGFVLSWNVKVYRADYRGTHGCEPVQPVYDDRWDAYVEQNDDLFWRACEDAGRYLLDGEYSTYPGDDQGAYRFMLNGRSGGHLCLMSCTIVPQPRRWRMAPFIFDDRATGKTISATSPLPSCGGSTRPLPAWIRISPATRFPRRSATTSMRTARPGRRSRRKPWKTRPSSWRLPAQICTPRSRRRSTTLKPCKYVLKLGFRYVVTPLPLLPMIPARMPPIGREKTARIVLDPSCQAALLLAHD